MIRNRSYEAELAFREGEEELMRHMISDPLMAPAARAEAFDSWLRKTQFRPRLVPTNPGTGASS